LMLVRDLTLDSNWILPVLVRKQSIFILQLQYIFLRIIMPCKILKMCYSHIQVHKIT
jgi:hypothetical protein